MENIFNINDKINNDITVFNDNELMNDKNKSKIYKKLINNLF